MKWTILISLLIISAESRDLFRRDADPHESRHIGDVYKKMTETDFRGLVLITFSQSLQKCDLDEISKLVEPVTSLAQACSNGARHLDCAKPIGTLFLDRICAIPELGSKYEWSTECCAKSDPERHTCFKEHKDLPHDALGPYKPPTADAICATYKEDKEKVLAEYIHAVSRRHPHLYSPAILSFTYHFNTIVTECCEEEDKDKCFSDRLKELRDKVHGVEAVQEETCRILDNFKERTLAAIDLAKVSQRYPKAPFEAVAKLAKELTHLKVDCCHGDMLECMIERMELTDHTCEHHEDLSTKLKSCCDKPLLERTECIIHLENDDIPETLSKKVTEFIEDPLVCEKYAKGHDVHLSHFLYEYSKRHPELSPTILTGITKGYGDLLDKCCATENPLDCLSHGPELIASEIQESKKVLKANCEAQDKHGNYLFHNILLIRYFRKMPEMRTQRLIEITEHMVEVGEKCCHLPEDKQIPCADGGLSVIIGAMCELEKTHPINKGVKDCCWSSYSGRRACFTNLGPDEDYKPPEVNPDTFHFTAELCTSDVHKVQHSKQELMIQLLKVKPKVTDEQLAQMIAEFHKISEKCCAAEDHQACFDAEKPALIEHCKELADH
ncbi:serum albumin-like [Discoglossus pictus]